MYSKITLKFETKKKKTVTQFTECFLDAEIMLSLVKADGTQEKVYKKILLMMMMETFKMFSWS